MLQKSLLALVIILVMTLALQADPILLREIDFETPYVTGYLSGQEGWLTAPGTYSNATEVVAETGNQFARGSFKPVGDHRHNPVISPTIAGGFEMLIDLRSSGFSIGEATTGTPMLIMVGNNTDSSSYNNGGVIFGWANRNGTMQFVACNGSGWWEATNYSVTSGWDTFKVVSDANDRTFSVSVSANQDGNYTPITFKDPTSINTNTTLDFWAAYPGYLVNTVRLYTAVGDTSKYVDVDNIAVSVTPADCNEVAYYGAIKAADIDENCKVDMLDLAELANIWLDCYDPNTANCF